MDLASVLSILAIVAVLYILLFGGKAKIGTEGVEIDTEGFITHLRKANVEKHVKSSPGEGLIALLLARIKTTKFPLASVLWVDDHPLNNLHERRMLAHLGIVADSYTTNADALNALKQSEYDLIISDIGRDSTTETGWDLCQQVRGTYPHLPFLFYTVGIDQARRKRVESLGAAGISERPGTLVRQIFSVISRV